MEIKTPEQAEKAVSALAEDLHQVSSIHDTVEAVVDNKDLADYYLKRAKNAFVFAICLALIAVVLRLAGVMESDNILAVGVWGGVTYAVIPASVVMFIFTLYSMLRFKQSAKKANMNQIVEMLTEERLDYIYKQVTAPEYKGVRTIDLVDWMKAELIDYLIAVKIAKGYKYELPQGAIGVATAHALKGEGVLHDSCLYKDFFIKVLGDYNNRLKCEVVSISEELTCSMASVAGSASFGGSGES